MKITKAIKQALSSSGKFYKPYTKIPTDFAEDKEPLHNKKKKRKRKTYRWPKSVCPFCDGDLKELPKQEKNYWSKLYETKCSCGAKAVSDCPGCHGETWYLNGTYKHQWLSCGFVGERKKL
jgi:hypothetical protein